MTNLTWQTKARLKYWASLRGLKNEKAPNWKGNKAGKSAIHKWMDANFGRPKTCEGLACKGKSVIFDWALKKGETYRKSRKAFYRLCRGCHLAYDMGPEKKAKALKNLIWNGADKAMRKNIAKTLGSITSKKKAESSRRNGKLGGRPKQGLITATKEL